MSNPILLKSWTAGAAINAFRFVKLSAADTVIQAAAVSDAIIGASNEVGAASGERQDVVHVGIVFIEAGAAFALGAELTSDSVGRAVASAPSAGVNNRIGAIALEAAGALGDIVRAQISLGTKQG